MWLVHTALDVVDDTIDTTLSAAKRVENIAQIPSRNKAHTGLLQPATSIAAQNAVQTGTSNTKDGTTASAANDDTKTSSKVSGKTDGADNANGHADDEQYVACVLLIRSTVLLERCTSMRDARL